MSIKHLSPRSDKEIKNAYSNLINASGTVIGKNITQWDDKINQDFVKISKILNVSLDDLYLINEEDKNYIELDELFYELIDYPDNRYYVEWLKTENGDWQCYPPQKLAKWHDDDMNNSGAWIFGKSFLKNKIMENMKSKVVQESIEEYVNESIKHLKPFSKKEMIRNFKKFRNKRKKRA